MEEKEKVVVVMLHGKRSARLVSELSEGSKFKPDAYIGKKRFVFYSWVVGAKNTTAHASNIVHQWEKSVPMTKIVSTLSAWGYEVIATYNEELPSVNNRVIELHPYKS